MHLKNTVDALPIGLINQPCNRWFSSTPGSHDLQGYVTLVMVIPNAIRVRQFAWSPLPR